MWKFIKNVGLYLWQLPQNLLGILLSGCYKTTQKFKYKDVVVRICPTFKNGISLGRYIILKNKNKNTIKHEYGHCIQSKRWGPLYLFTVGIVSITHNKFCNCKKHKHGNYYNIWPENEADRLGGVTR